MRRLPWLGLAFALAGTIAASCVRSEIELPRTPPSIAGTITAADPAGEHLGSIRVEAVPGEEAGSDKAVVRIEQGTALVNDSGQRIGLSQLKVGRKVRVWFTGPVRESYPVQADAATIILEPAGR
jgi:beta-N-acetylhexosaminidase